MHWPYSDFEPDFLPTTTPVTIKDLVRFDGLTTRLPSRITDILTDLYRHRKMVGRARVESGEENGQKTLDIHLQLLKSRPHRYGYSLGPDLDDIYEGIEGAGSERLLVRAHIREVERPETRFLTLDESELLPIDGLEADACAEEEEAFLLTTEHDVLGNYAEEVYEHLDIWADQNDARTKPQYLKIMRNGEVVNLQAVEMPLTCTLALAQEFAERLNTALGLGLAVQLAPRQAEQRRLPGDVYETARDMARRLRGKV